MIGWIGSIALGICGAPQAWKAYQDGHAEGLDTSFLALWTVGDVCTLYAVLGDAPIAYLIANYMANLVFLSVMWKYKFWPRKL
jgi:hypothetical protein